MSCTDLLCVLQSGRNSTSPSFPSRSLCHCTQQAHPWNMLHCFTLRSTRLGRAKRCLHTKVADHRLVCACVSTYACVSTVDQTRCGNCGSTAHKSWKCPEQRNFVNTVKCTRCGGGGHIAADCNVDLSVCNCHATHVCVHCLCCLACVPIYKANHQTWCVVAVLLLCRRSTRMIRGSPKRKWTVSTWH